MRARQSFDLGLRARGRPHDVRFQTIRRIATSACPGVVRAVRLAATPPIRRDLMQEPGVDFVVVAVRKAA
jgi:hypothetical protein